MCPSIKCTCLWCGKEFDIIDAVPLFDDDKLGLVSPCCDEEYTCEVQQ